MSLSHQAQPIIDSVRALEASAWRILRRAGDPEAPNGAVFSLLADETRVLPTTPAWSQVSLAIQRLEAARHDIGSAKDLDRDLQVLLQFRDMLNGTWPTLEPLWVTSAFLGGVRGGDDPADSLRFGLALLSAALDFAGTRTEVVNSRVEGVRAELGRLTGTELSIGTAAPPAAGFTPDTDARVQTARAAGVACAQNADWPMLERAAWNELEKRVSGPTDSPDVAVQIKAPTLLCAAASRGPGTMLPLSQRPVTLLDCTRLLSAGLSRAPTGAPETQPVPITVVAYALRRLGSGTLPRSLVRQLTDSVVALRGSSKDDAHRLSELLPQDPHRRSERIAPQIAIVVGTFSQSAALPWVTTPTRGVALVVTETEAPNVLASLTKLFESWPVRPALVVESARARSPMDNWFGLSAEQIENVQLLHADDSDSPSLSGSPNLQLLPTPDGADKLLIALASDREHPS